MTEGRNTGFKKILDALEINGSPKPEFETDENHSYFISRLFVHEAFLKEKEPKKSRKELGRKQTILEFLKENPTMTQTMLMDLLKLSRKQIQKDMKELQEEDLLEREGSNRNGRWIVK